MGSPHSKHGTTDLRAEVAWHLPPGETALRCVRNRDGGIEVRARDWAESENQSYERGTCRNGVGKERDCLVAGRQAIRHDARPNNRCQQ